MKSCVRLAGLRKCSGVPYTKKSDLFCDGWTGISLEECEQKCIKNEVEGLGLMIKQHQTAI